MGLIGELGGGLFGLYTAIAGIGIGLAWLSRQLSERTKGYVTLIFTAMIGALSQFDLHMLAYRFPITKHFPMTAEEAPYGYALLLVAIYVGASLMWAAAVYGLGRALMARSTQQPDE